MKLIKPNKINYTESKMYKMMLKLFVLEYLLGKFLGNDMLNNECAIKQEKELMKKRTCTVSKHIVETELQ